MLDDYTIILHIEVLVPVVCAQSDAFQKKGFLSTEVSMSGTTLETTFDLKKTVWHIVSGKVFYLQL